MSRISPRYRHLRLIAGSPGPGPGGIQEAFIEAVRAFKRSEPLRPLVVLVGSNYLRQHLSRLLAVRLGGHANVQFLLLQDLARQLGTTGLVEKGRRRIPRWGREVLLKEVVAAHAHGTYFERIAGKQGFLESLSATIRDLKDAGIDPVSLKAAARSLEARPARSGVERITARKLRDLADLHEAYEERLHLTRFHDSEDLMRSAVSAAAADGPDVIVYGFYDATWLQKKLIQHYLAFKSGTVFFPRAAEQDNASRDYSRALLEWFRSWIGEFRQLASPGREAGARDTRILSAPGEGREALEAVRWLVDQARDQSVPFGELALVYRSQDPYRSLLADILETSGVPHFLADGRPLSTTRAGRVLSLLLNVRREDYSRAAVIDFLTLARPQEDASRWDCLSMLAGVVKGIQQWRDGLARLAVAGKGRRGTSVVEAQAARAAEQLRAQVEGLHAALEALPAEGTWRETAAGLLAVTREYAGSDPSFAPLEELVTLLGGLDAVSSPVDLEQFTELLGRALEQPVHDRERDGRFQRSGIFVGNVIDARLLTFHAVAVLGLVEKSFPAPARQDPILLDEERDLIGRLVGSDRLGLRLERLHEESVYFRMISAAAAESLLLCYPRLDPATARPRNPSPFLLSAAGRLEGQRVGFDELDGLERTRRIGLAQIAPERPAQALIPREYDLSLLGLASSDGAHRQRLAAFFHGNPLLHRALQAEEDRWGKGHFTAHDGVIMRPNLLDALRSVHARRHAHVSATRIEDYARCPLAYFMKNVLGLAALPAPEDHVRLDPMRRGRLVHRILLETFSALRDRDALPLSGDGLDMARRILEETATRLFDEEERHGMTGYPLLWRIDKEAILRDLDRVLAREALEESGFIPAHFELRYGGASRTGDADDPASTEEPIPFESPDRASVLLQGMIDRVDRTADGSVARVTDYKTGRMQKYKQDQLLGGCSVQLPLYMMAVRRLLAGSPPAPREVEGRYLSVDHRGRFRKVTFSAQALADCRDDLARVLATYENGVTRGVFLAYPTADNCKFCDYQLACGEGREARFERKRQDPTAADYLRMREGIA